MGYSIVFIAPSARLTELFAQICREQGRDIPVITGELEDGVKRAREVMENGIDVIISRGGTAHAIRRLGDDIPVVEVPVTGFDVIRAILEARQGSERVLVAGFPPFTGNLEGWGERLGIRLRVVTLDDRIRLHPELLREELRASQEQGFERVVGDTFATRLAEELGIRTVLIQSGREALLQAIAEAERVADVRRTEMEKARRFQSITHFAHEGIVSVDTDGTVSLFNPSAERILELPASRVVGRPVSEVLPGMDLMRSLETGEHELEKLLTVGEIKIAANVIPIRLDGEVRQIVATFQKVSGIQKLEQKIRREVHFSGMVAENTFQDIVGQSPAIRHIKKEAEEFARFDLPVFLYGETGTGKELLAQAIHNSSPRKDKPFVAFNCAALPESLLESELFGYTEGAFTGASKGGKPGLFELAHGGTIFLDEVGEVSVASQIRLLRVLEERKIRRIGDDRLTPVDVRVIVATNQDMSRLVEEHKFRQDLFYRINVLVLRVPPLRNRRTDIPLLATMFVKKYGLLFGKASRTIDPDALAVLSRYSWPGNIRQLQNVVERIVIKSRGSRIGVAIVEDSLRSEGGFIGPSAVGPSDESGGDHVAVPVDLSLAEMERLLIRRIIRDTGGNRAAAAERLGIGRTTLWRRLKE